MELRTTVGLTLASFALTAFVISNAFYQKKQFYPSVVYVTKSNPSMAILYVQALVFVYLLGQMVRKVFFGQLRAAESEHLAERAWYAVTETCLAFTVFRDDFSPKFVAQFTFLLFLKCFHWLAEDRVDYMERSPIITILFHCRLMSVIALLSSCDSYFVSHAYFTTLLRGASVQIVFGFEYAILMTIIFHISIKYILHSIDLRNAHPWENKAVYLLYTELVIGFFRVILYTFFMIVMMKLHTFPLFSIRPMYLTLRAFKKAVNDVVMSRRAINYLNYLYPDARDEELQQGDNVCIICREEMVGGGAKKLPCNHIFHASCLRSWFQRQQTCPTCRLDIIQATVQQTPLGAAEQARVANLQRARVLNAANVNQAAANANQGPAPAVGQQQGQQPAHPPHPQMPNLAAMFPFIPPGFMPHAQAPPVHPHIQPGTHTQQGASGVQGGVHMNLPNVQQGPFSVSQGPFGFPMMAPPMMPPMMPFMLPFPSPPNFNALNDEEVLRMEAQTRQGVVARIQCLRNIQTLLDSAAVQLQQYLSLMPIMSLESGLSETELGRTESVSVADEAASSSAAGTSNDSGPADPGEEIRLRRLARFDSKARIEPDGQQQQQ